MLHHRILRRSVLFVALLLDAAAIPICTDHEAVDYRMLAARARLVLDTRNACAGCAAGTIVRA